MGPGTNPWLTIFYHWDCAPMVKTTGTGNFGSAHDCVVTSSCMNQAEELNRIQQIQNDQEYAADEPARQRANTAVTSSPYYSPGMADVVMGNLASWSKSAYPALTTYSVVMLAAPLAMMGADLPILARGATFLQIESPSIVPIGQYVPYTSIPNGFYVQAGGRWFNVIPSGAKHLVEYGARYAEFAEPIRGMNMAYTMTSFRAALSELSASGYTYGAMYKVGGWEFGVSAAQKGFMDVLFHALPLF